MKDKLANFKNKTVLKKVSIISKLKGLNQRLGLIKEINDVKYYIVSSANSPSQTITILNSFNQKVILICGGYDKQAPFDMLGEVLIKKVKHLILMGQTASLIEMSVLKKLTGKYRGIELRITRCHTMQQAVDCAYLS
ncbi:MAG: UDP-N-acetylmuramoyl-L-alanine--D-glutamate ligase, partial [Clostridiaceae bacterium]|nr:UDP-N-acetylmuramoyl-L-alanine--D-glutamate ligase [Clostridiaceae bacterium]